MAGLCDLMLGAPSASFIPPPRLMDASASGVMEREKEGTRRLVISIVYIGGGCHCRVPFNVKNKRLGEIE